MTMTKDELQEKVENLQGELQKVHLELQKLHNDKKKLEPKIGDYGLCRHKGEIWFYVYATVERVPLRLFDVTQKCDGSEWVTLKEVQILTIEGNIKDMSAEKIDKCVINNKQYSVIRCDIDCNGVWLRQAEDRIVIDEESIPEFRKKFNKLTRNYA